MIEWVPFRWVFLSDARHATRKALLRNVGCWRRATGRQCVSRSAARFLRDRRLLRETWRSPRNFARLWDTVRCFVPSRFSFPCILRGHSSRARREHHNAQVPTVQIRFTELESSVRVKGAKSCEFRAAFHSVSHFVKSERLA